MIKKRSWRITVPKDFRTIQNLEPLEDDIVHKWGLSCDCKPKKVLQMSGPDVLCVQIVHNALDGRE